MRIDYLLCYDIKDDSRLNRVLRYMKGKGIHLQYSVFHCHLTHTELLKLMDDIKSLIDENEDDVRIYPLLANFNAIVLGRGARIPKGVDVFFD
ncbi:MAG: CRISPR-associated endonuclease Cas2 [Clostridiales bacterium]|nr:CRISPR-associated endonuclease Cas2 [Clostridiales bacterium]